MQKFSLHSFFRNDGHVLNARKTLFKGRKFELVSDVTAVVNLALLKLRRCYSGDFSECRQFLSKKGFKHKVHFKSFRTKIRLKNGTSMLCVSSCHLRNIPGMSQTGGRGGVCPPPVFGRSVNPISTRGGTLSPPSLPTQYCTPPRFSDLETCLHSMQSIINGAARDLVEFSGK